MSEKSRAMVISYQFDNNFLIALRNIAPSLRFAYSSRSNFFTTVFILLTWNGNALP